VPGASDPQKTVAIIGAGKVGTAMAHLLSTRGYDVVAVADPRREARERAAELSGAKPFERGEDAAATARIIIITTPDGAIEDACRHLAASGIPLVGKKVLHMSGALSLGALKAAADQGADTLSIHPIQTFADLEGAERTLPGSSFGVTCEPRLQGWALDFVSDLEGRVLMVTDADKVLYHAAAVVACHLLAMVQYGAHVISRKLGFDDEEAARAFTPLATATIENVARLGPAAALTGPLARGDVGTLAAHLEALEGLDPELASMYRTVSLWGLRLVEERGELDPETIGAMRALLSKT
jgi:predicted short-subunit dehydrogenase-like oxidoreductase (DUF2520 family)